MSRPSPLPYLILLAFGSASAHAATVTANFELDAGALPLLESSAVSTVDRFFCVPCTITHTVNNGTAAVQNFNWVGPGFVAPAPANAAATTRFTTWQSVVEKAGNITFAPAAVAGPASYFQPVRFAILDAIVEVVALYQQGGQDVARFASSLEPLGNGQWRYTHSAQNLTNSSLAFSWSPLGATTLAPLAVHSTGFDAANPAQEIFATAFFQEAGGDWAGPAHFFAPVPEPGTWAMMLAGLAGICIAARKRGAV